MQNTGMQWREIDRIAEKNVTSLAFENHQGDVKLTEITNN